jgi:uncharacterized protein (TIGR02117 family)
VILKKGFKILIRSFKLLFAVIILYAAGSVIFTWWTVNKSNDGSQGSQTIYLETSGVHADFVFKTNALPDKLHRFVKNDDEFTSFGWGDENFYINTPTWGDLTVKNACIALFWKSSSLMHVTEFKQQHREWVAVKMTDEQFAKLTDFISTSFSSLEDKTPIKGYSTKDYFFKAKDSYSCFNTCNTWVNQGMKSSGMKAAVWTPFDFGIINKYK